MASVFLIGSRANRQRSPEGSKSSGSQSSSEVPGPVWGFLVTWPHDSPPFSIGDTLRPIRGYGPSKLEKSEPPRKPFPSHDTRLGRVLSTTASNVR